MALVVIAIAKTFHVSCFLMNITLLRFKNTTDMLIKW